jgi:hypothetical protein
MEARMKSRYRMFLSTFVFLTLSATGNQAWASNCWQITGWLNTLNQPSSGTVGDHANLVSTLCVAPAPAGYGWLHPTLGYSSSAPGDLYVRISLSDGHVSGNQFSPLLIYNGMSGGKPVLNVDLTVCLSCGNKMSFVSQPGPCTRTMTWLTGSLIASFDGANCYVGPVPSGANPFIYANNYYVARVPSTICQVGSYDGANCYVMPIPSGGFIYNNSFYTTAGSNNSCSVGSFDGVNCFILSVPPGSQAFTYSGAFYATTRQCTVGWYDGANCYLGTPPSTAPPATAFIYAGSFYYSE